MSESSESSHEVTERFSSVAAAFTETDTTTFDDCADEDIHRAKGFQNAILCTLFNDTIVQVVGMGCSGRRQEPEVTLQVEILYSGDSEHAEEGCVWSFFLSKFDGVGYVPDIEPDESTPVSDYKLIQGGPEQSEPYPHRLLQPNVQTWIENHNQPEQP